MKYDVVITYGEYVKADSKAGAPFPSMVVVFRERNLSLQRLKNLKDVIEEEL